MTIRTGDSTAAGGGHQPDTQAQQIADKLIQEVGAWTKHAPTDSTTTAALDKTMRLVNASNVAAVNEAIKEDPAAQHLPKLSVGMESGPFFGALGSSNPYLNITEQHEQEEPEVVSGGGAEARFIAPKIKDEEVTTDSTYQATPSGFQQPGFSASVGSVFDLKEPLTEWGRKIWADLKARGVTGLESDADRIVSVLPSLPNGSISPDTVLAKVGDIVDADASDPIERFFATTKSMSKEGDIFHRPRQHRSDPPRLQDSRLRRLDVAQ